MSLQIKKPLSAQAVGTDMYKNGGVNQIKPATKQPEWSTKSLKYYGETEKKRKEKLLPTSKMSNLTQRMDLKQAMIGLTSSILELNYFRHSGSDFSSCDTELQKQSKTDQTFLTQGCKSDFFVLKFMLY